MKVQLTDKLVRLETSEQFLKAGYFVCEHDLHRTARGKLIRRRYWFYKNGKKYKEINQREVDRLHKTCNLRETSHPRDHIYYWKVR